MSLWVFTVQCCSYVSVWNCCVGHIIPCCIKMIRISFTLFAGWHSSLHMRNILQWNIFSGNPPLEMIIIRFDNFHWRRSSSTCLPNKSQKFTLMTHSEPTSCVLVKTYTNHHFQSVYFVTRNIRGKTTAHGQQQEHSSSNNFVCQTIHKLELIEFSSSKELEKWQTWVTTIVTSILKVT